eukprot:SAG25_NODE_147_length_13803_cov_29.064361_11_plen_109_part_00
MPLAHSTTKVSPAILNGTGAAVPLTLIWVTADENVWFAQPLGGGGHYDPLVHDHRAVGEGDRERTAGKAAGHELRAAGDDVLPVCKPVPSHAQSARASSPTSRHAGVG